MELSYIDTNGKREKVTARIQISHGVPFIVIKDSVITDLKTLLKIGYHVEEISQDEKDILTKKPARE